MKKLQNTLYISTPNRYISLDGENVVVSEDKTEIGRVPLHNLEAIVSYGYTGASPALMGACAERGIALSFMTANGRFLARVTGKVNGNVTLRRQQFRIADDAAESLKISKNMLLGKVYNAKWVLERCTRDYPLRVDTAAIKAKSATMGECLQKIRSAPNSDTLRGYEGDAALAYFSVFNQMLLQQKEDFAFEKRSRRPPLDRINSLMSFIYSLTAGMCASALEAIGLDPAVGFFHTDRPGRASLALDLMEEFRAVLCDRFVLGLINLRVVNAKDFIIRENGAVIMTDDTRSAVLKAWQTKKYEEITHPFLGEKIEWGMLPYVQAMLLARSIRGDLEEYPPFLWK
ncbi:MAG: type I-C CRISPR-associated endonuclease Cas1c [Oscillospiraceae bacterium]